jgi:hypothetical protein
MAEFFGKNSEYRNMIDDPYLRMADQRKPFNNCCGFAATGDEILATEEVPQDDIEPVKSQVMNLQAWKYAKTGLAIIGAYVVIKYLYGKIKK